jgi:hypothetical protein
MMEERNQSITAAKKAWDLYMRDRKDNPEFYTPEYLNKQVEELAKNLGVSLKDVMNRFRRPAEYHSECHIGPKALGESA